MSRVLCVTLASTLLCCAVISGASFEPVTFNDLVAQAEVIFSGEVVDVHPFPVDTRDGRIIKTRVTFKIDDPMYGTKGLVEVLDFLGGEWDGIGLAVPGMPTFRVGDRRVVFARHDGSINPIVGFDQGLLQIVRDSGGTDRVLTLNGQPIASTESFGSARRTLPGPVVPMRLADFTGDVMKALAEAGKR